MKKVFSVREKRLIALSCVLAFCLVVALICTFILGARERARLEALRAEESLAADRQNATSTAPSPAHKTGGLALLGRGITDFHLFYFGDEMMYGGGVTDTLSTEVDCYRTMLKENLQTYYGTEFLGRIPCLAIDTTRPPSEGNGSPPLWVCDVDFADGAQKPSVNFRLAILAPSSRTAEAGAGGHPRNGFTGHFAHDLELTVRNMRKNAQYCDILLVVPHDATEEIAAPILAIAAHYGLRSVDMRTLEAAALTEEGLPNEAGHRAYADAITAEILAAAEEGHTMPSALPNHLYN